MQLITNIDKPDAIIYSPSKKKVLFGFEDLEANMERDVLEDDFDESEQLPENPYSKKGDIFILGKHRLMCGDSTIASDVEKLCDGTKADMIFTDPPYNVDYEGGTEMKIQNDKQIATLSDELKDVQILMENLIKENKIKKQSQDEYNIKYNSLVNRFESIRNKQEELIKKKEEKINKANAMNAFIFEIENKPNLIDSFDINLWIFLIDEAIVHKDKIITFKFRNGIDIIVK